MPSTCFLNVALLSSIYLFILYHKPSVNTIVNFPFCDYYIQLLTHGYICHVSANVFPKGHDYHFTTALIHNQFLSW